MREQALLVLMVSGAAACAGRPAATTLTHGPAMTSTYACNSQLVKREAGNVFAATDGRLAMAFQDDAGDHFVALPETPTSTRAVEYVMPNDHRANAVERIYDTSRGQSRADWRIVDENVCVVKGGYTDAFSMFASGSSMDDIANRLGLENRIEARRLIQEGLRAAQANMRAVGVRLHKEW